MSNGPVILSGPVAVGPDGSGTYRYMISGLISEHAYHNSASAAFDGRRPQRITKEGFLVPESTYSPYVN